MSYLAPILVVFALVAYTTPDDHPIYVNRDQVVAITKAHDYDCKPGAQTKIITGNGYSCVQETLEEVVRILNETK